MTMTSSAIVLHDVLPLSSAAVVLMPALIVVLSAIVVTLSVLLARALTASSAAVWSWVQSLPTGARRFRRQSLDRLGMPCH
jgi:hypothetical protein